MNNRIPTAYIWWLNNSFSLKFQKHYLIQQAFESGWEYNGWNVTNQGEDNSSNNSVYDNDDNPPSKKFRQYLTCYCCHKKNIFFL